MKKTVFFGLMVIMLSFGFIGCGNSTGGNGYEEFTVTFDLDGGNISGNISSVNIKVRSGETITNLPSPKKEVNSFEGWYTQKNGAGSPFDSSTIVTGDLIVYAKWQSNVLLMLVERWTYDGNNYSQWRGPVPLNFFYNNQLRSNSTYRFTITGISDTRMEKIGAYIETSSGEWESLNWWDDSFNKVIPVGNFSIIINLNIRDFDALADGIIINNPTFILSNRQNVHDHIPSGSIMASITNLNIVVEPILEFYANRWIDGSDWHSNIRLDNFYQQPLESNTTYRINISGISETTMERVGLYIAAPEDEWTDMTEEYPVHLYKNIPAGDFSVIMYVKTVDFGIFKPGVDINKNILLNIFNAVDVPAGIPHDTVISTIRNINILVEKL